MMKTRIDLKMKKTTKTGTVNTVPKKKKNILLVTTAALAGLVLCVGLTLGIVNLVLSANAVVEYEGVRISKKVGAYLASTYKTAYIAELKKDGVTEAMDNEYFWASKTPEGITYAEDFERAAGEYISRIAIGCYLYDRNSDLTDAVKKRIKNKARQTAELYYMTEDFEDLFEKDAEAMGYDYDAYEQAAIMLYKSAAARNAVYGSKGEGVALIPGACEEYLNRAYTHVEFVFIRTATTYAVDEVTGERLKDSSGGYQKIILDSQKRQQRSLEAERLKALIDDYKKGGSGVGATALTPETVRAVADKYLGDQSATRLDGGYYFSALSEYTASFVSASSLAPAVELALTLTLDVQGSAYGYVTLDLEDEDGERETVECFMYKSTPRAYAYADASLSDFFSDFYSDCADYTHRNDVTARLGDVKIKDAFYELDVALIPRNTTHVIRELY